MERLRDPMPPDRLTGWIVTVVITALAGVLRMVRLGQPAEMMFDEGAYARDAWSLLVLGYEGVWGDPGTIDPSLGGVAYGGFGRAAEWATHPEVGKWLIASGEWLFGLNPVGWRFAALVFGTLLVGVTIRLARRLSRSTLIGALAGGLLAVDGLSFVMSRIALLDIFQAFFLVAGVSCVVADRDFFRHRLAAHIADLPGQTLAGRAGPYIVRPWLLGAGVAFGLATGTKWNSVFPLAVFGIVVVVWSLAARRLAGAGRRTWWSLLTDGVPAFVSLVVVGLATYIATWIPWLRVTTSVDWPWGPAYPDTWVARHLGAPWADLWTWHVATYRFHTGPFMMRMTHVYGSSPWVWPVMGRTTGIYAVNGIPPGTPGCTAPVDQTCLGVVTALGTPVLWWAVLAAMLVGLVWWLAGRDWRFGVAILGYASTWVPWVLNDRGAKFSFYAITMIPFGVIALALAAGVVLHRLHRRRTKALVVGVIVGLVAANFALIYPVLTGLTLTQQQYAALMWLPGWT